MFTSVSLLSSEITTDLSKLSSLETIEMWNTKTGNSEKTEKTVEKEKRKYFRFLCISGDLDGRVESRILSSDQVTEEIRFSKQISAYPVLKLYKADHCDQNEIGVFDCQRKEAETDSCFRILSLHSDGVLISLLFAENGVFRYDIISPFLNFSIQPKNVLQVPKHGNCQLYAVGEKEIIEIRQFDRNSDSIIDGFEGPVGAAGEQSCVGQLGDYSVSVGSSTCSSDNESSLNSNLYSKQKGRGKSQSIGELSVTTLHVDEKGSNPGRFRFEDLELDSWNLGGDSLFVGKNKIQMMKKDKKILELFRLVDTQNNGFISRKQVPNFLLSWIQLSNLNENNDSAAQSTHFISDIVERLSDPDLKNQKVQFLDIVQIAVVIKNHYAKYEKKRIKKKIDFNVTKSGMYSVTYGITGEKIIEKKELSPIKTSETSGDKSSRSNYSNPRKSKIVMTEKPRIMENAGFEYLKGVPLSMRHILDIQNMENNSKFHVDLRRTVRICRTLLDMYSKNHFDENLIHDLSEVNRRTVKHFHSESVADSASNNDYDNEMNSSNTTSHLNDRDNKEKEKRKNKPKTVKSHTNKFPEFILQYFLQNFGVISRNILHQRIFKFLEAILKYSKSSPVIGILNFFLFYEENRSSSSEDTEADQKLLLALYLNSRNYFLTQGLVVSGPYVPT